MLLVPLAAFIAMLPMLRDGCSCGQDIDFHLLNWIDASDHWRAGLFYPHWAHWAAWGAGEPRFVFYPPLSWMLGGALGSLASMTKFSAVLWPWVPVVLSFIVMTAAGFAAYSLARTRASQNAAVFAAVFYVVNPYMLFVAYQRGAYGEFVAAIWMPLLLRALLAEEISIAGVALPIALLWLSNAPAAVMGCYSLALVAVVRLVMLWRGSQNSTSCIQFAAKISGGLVLGLGLAAFYIVPAAFERHWVQIENALATNMNPSQNFLFEHTSDPVHDAVLRQASTVAVLLIVLTAIFLAVAWRKKNSAQQPTLVLLSALTLAIVIGLLPVSLPLWKHLPQLIFLQFPWRFLAVLSTVTVVAIALAVPIKKHAWLLLAVVLPMIAAPASYYFFRQYCEGDDLPELHGQGVLTAPTDEYTPRPADGDVLQPHPQPYWLTNKLENMPVAGSAAPKEISVVTSNIENFRYTADLKTPQLLVLDLWEYPAWRVTVNGTEFRKRPLRDDGLMEIPLPAGHSNIAVWYAQTADRTVGQGITLLALCVAAWLWRAGRLSSRELCRRT
jgi:hypothetical protein